VSNRDILKENGSAVDAAVAALFCLGIHDAQSAGIGGGFHMVVHDTYVNFTALILHACTLELSYH